MDFPCRYCFAPDGTPSSLRRSFARHVLGQPLDKPWRPWCLTQYYKTRVVRDQRFKLYSTGAFFDLSEDPLEKHDLAGTSAMKQPDARDAHARLQQVLASLPADAKLPWEFRSISARKIRAEEARRRAGKRQEKGP